MYGNPETTPGGRALKFYSSVRMEVRKGEVIKSGSEIIGAKTRVKITKNKVAPPFKECEFDLIYGKGISRTGEVLDLAVNLDIIKKSGSWFSYGDQKLGQGRDKVKDLLEKDPEFMKEIEEKILADKEKTKELLSVTSDDEPSAEAGAETAVTDTDLVIEAPSDDENFDEFTPVES